MTTAPLIDRFNAAKQALSQAKSEFDTATSRKADFLTEALQRHLAAPSAATSYHEQISPVSHIGTLYAEGLTKGWTLKAMRPSQFSVVLVWQTDDVTKKVVESRCKALAQDEWSRYIEPVETKLSYAQYEFDRVSAEVAELKDVFSQVA